MLFFQTVWLIPQKFEEWKDIWISFQILNFKSDATKILSFNSIGFYFDLKFAWRKIHRSRTLTRPCSEVRTDFINILYHYKLFGENRLKTKHLISSYHEWGLSLIVMIILTLVSINRWHLIKTNKRWITSSIPNALRILTRPLSIALFHWPYASNNI